MYMYGFRYVGDLTVPRSTENWWIVRQSILCNNLLRIMSWGQRSLAKSVFEESIPPQQPNQQAEQVMVIIATTVM